MDIWNKLAATWTSLQVELHGQYSLHRLHALREYSAQASVSRVLAAVVLTPLPCLLAVAITDAIPLAPPEDGIHRVGYWIRSPFATFVYSQAIVTQLCAYVPQLNMPRSEQLLVSVPTTVLTTGVQYGLGAAIGFPVPFALPIIAQPWTLFLGFFFWLRRGKLLQQHADVRSDLVWYSLVLVCQLSLVVVYPVFFAIFSRCSSAAQTACAFLLPVIKLAEKNLMSRVLHLRDDVRPEIVILNVEVFNALFVACCMQSSTSITTSLVLMAADFLQACASLHDLNAILSEFSSTASRLGVPANELLETAMAILRDDPTTAAHPRFASLSQDLTSRQSFVMPHRIVPRDSMIAHRESVKKIAVLASQSAVKSSAVRLPVRVVAQDATRSLALPSQVPHAPRLLNKVAPHPVMVAPTTLPTSLTTAQPPIGAVLPAQDRLELVQRALRVLHMTEFLLLVEFTEVMIPIVYCIYLVMIFHLPNRAYYPQLRSMDDARLASTIQSVLLYATMELISFIALYVVLKRKLRLSALHQLAFVLETQWTMVQAKLVLWVVFMVQSTLVHQGADYSFKFAWLRHPNPTDQMTSVAT